jgi:hypothetical protein
MGTAGFSSGDDRVYEGDFGRVLDVLASPSPWQEFILDNLKVARKKASFHVKKIADFDNVMNRLGYTQSNSRIPGVTDKNTGAITMQEWGLNTDSTLLLWALHEAVHLVSHPPEQGSPHSTAFAFQSLGEGLCEGLVEMVAEDILTAPSQALGLPKDKNKLGHHRRLAIMRALCGDMDGAVRPEQQERTALLPRTSYTFWARALFKGESDQVALVMSYWYSSGGWGAIKNFAIADDDGSMERALKLIPELRQAQMDLRARRARVTPGAVHAQAAMIDRIIRYG